MHSVYVLKSSKDQTLYVGMTSKDPRDRLVEHNQGKNKYTSMHKPYELIYYEMHYHCAKCAREREKFLKSGVGKQIIQKIIAETRFSLT